jgi:hypothetical protein
VEQDGGCPEVGARITGCRLVVRNSLTSPANSARILFAIPLARRFGGCFPSGVSRP